MWVSTALLGRARAFLRLRRGDTDRGSGEGLEGGAEMRKEMGVLLIREGRGRGEVAREAESRIRRSRAFGMSR